MKRLVLLMLVLTSTFTANAQEGKPTKEQTVEYIQNFFLNHSTRKYTKSGMLIVGTKDYTFGIDNTIVSIKYKIWAGPSTYDENFIQFDLKQIERIVPSGAKFSDGCSHTISFHAYNGNKIISTENGKTDVVDVLIYAPGRLDCDSDISDEKIFKAFKYLSKLCGSPEPIRFD